jgi:hypothetical protein
MIVSVESGQIIDSRKLARKIFPQKRLADVQFSKKT